VDFPIAVVSKHAAREKSIRHGHPSTLHIWWARRPLASCRAVLLGLLWPDPCDPLCPQGFKHEARRRLDEVPACRPGQTDLDLRHALLRFIGDFANWDAAAHPLYLEVSRALVKAAHGDEAPLVVDPFAGGGSIPLEALRVGCEAFASDLNPVDCLILKVMLEDIPRHGPGLADELRRAGATIKQTAEKDLADLYPRDPDGATPIAYLWARTVRCESPSCGAEISLVRSFWLCKKSSRRRALRYRVERPKKGLPQVELEVFEPKSDKDVPAGTVAGAKATCLCCGKVLPPERVRAQLAAQHGGADTIFDERGRRTGGARMLAVVTLEPAQRGRQYRLPAKHDYEAVWRASKRLRRVLEESKPGEEPVPNEPTPQDGTGSVGGGFRTRKYGVECFGDFFTERQKLALHTISQRCSHGHSAGSLLAIVCGRCLDYWSSGAIWAQSGEFVAHTFGRQA
jgi:putative DNA methylase